MSSTLFSGQGDMLAPSIHSLYTVSCPQYNLVTNNGILKLGVTTHPHINTIFLALFKVCISKVKVTLVGKVKIGIPTTTLLQIMGFSKTILGTNHHHSKWI